MKKGEGPKPFPFFHAGTKVSAAWLLLKRQGHVTQVTFGLNQNERAFVDLNRRRALTWHMNSLGLGRNCSLGGRDPGGIRIDPLKA